MKMKILGLITVLFLAACTPGNGDSSLLSITDSGRIEVVDNMFYDWKDINIRSGKVENTFEMRNAGEDELIIKTAFTSCACTKATIKLPDGSLSPEFSMHQAEGWGAKILPGEEFSISVVFDPMAHGPTATGPITRSVFIETSSIQNGNYAKKDAKSGSMLTELKLAANVLSEEAFNRFFELNN